MSLESEPFFVTFTAQNQRRNIFSDKEYAIREYVDNVQCFKSVCVCVLVRLCVRSAWMCVCERACTFYTA